MEAERYHWLLSSFAPNVFASSPPKDVRTNNINIENISKNGTFFINFFKILIL
jgi:hypothetical protein